MNALLDHPETMAPTEEQRQAAREASEKLSEFLGLHDQFKLQPVEFERPGEAVILPATAVELLRKVLAQMAAGNAVKVVPIPAEMTAHEAADFLNVSSPYVFKLLESKKLPFREAGTLRLIRLQDLVDYKRQSDAECEAALEALAAQAQELGLGY